MEILGKLFGSSARVKLMRMFLFHSNGVFDSELIRQKTRLPEATVKKELNMLVKIGFIGRVKLTAPLREKLQAEKKKKKHGQKRAPASGFQLNHDFVYLRSLEQMLLGSEILDRSEVSQKLEQNGKLKFVVASGVFLGSSDSRLDLLIVGEKIKHKSLEAYLRSLEAEIGRELMYSVMNTEEFQYRRQVYDKLVRDVLDYPHEVLVDRLG